ncbi:MAG: glycosyltransferase, partial [Proteobacteria bacterium]|nr:glycosyltransferase [Pseudomonadota bacterium]
DPQVLAALRALHRKERVHELGFRPDAASLLRLCDFVVMPSREREGFGKAVVEGMAQGIPAIVSRVGGMPELVEHNRSGLVVEPKDPEALAQALLTLANHSELRKELGAHARKRIEETFTISRTIDQTFAMYQEVLGGG